MVHRKKENGGNPGQGPPLWNVILKSFSTGELFMVITVKHRYTVVSWSIQPRFLLILVMAFLS